MKTITIKIDEDNDIYEMIVNGEERYSLDNGYESKYSKLFDELNMVIELQVAKYITKNKQYDLRTRNNI
jgi:cytidylate kinase